MKSEFVNSADTRETSVEIMEAIEWLADGKTKTANRIWEAPTELEMNTIWERVTKNGLVPSSDFCWGEEGNRWGVSVEEKTL